jgi:hypothetical protein
LHMWLCPFAQTLPPFSLLNPTHLSTLP